MRNILVSFLVIIPLFAKAQTVYVDPTTTGALVGYSFSLKNGQNKISEQQSSLKKAQAFVSSQMALINDVQNKIYKGLSEVSGTISNGIQVKNILFQLDDCRRYSANITEIVRRNPHYAIFGAKSSEKALEEIMKIGSEVSGVIASGGKNLMTAGDRYKLLDSIESKVRMFKIWLITIQLGLENAERVGFWRSINPFRRYINTDKDIVENIMHRFKNHF